MTHSQILIMICFGGLILGFARHLPAFALNRPVALLMSLVGIGLAGILAFWILPVELMPNNSFGIITITTPVRGGMSPTEIERQITKPIEESVASVAHVRNLISNSTAGKSVVSIEFEPGTEMDFATLDVREKFSRVKGDLPKEIESPIIAHYRESDVPVHIFAFTSANRTPEELRQLIDHDLKEKLMRVKGVANADVAGGRERKIVINVDRNRLAASGLDIRRLVRELEEANINMKAGIVGSESAETSIRTMGQFESVEEVANTVIGVSPQGTSLRLKDVADTKDSYLEQESLARLNGDAAVTVYVQKESIANTVQVVSKTSAVLEKFKKTLPADITMVEISNQAEAIKEAIRSVKMALAIGICLIVVILGYILGVVPALVVASSIPLVTLIVVCLMYFEKLSINVMTLSGLALGIGLLVDNSIVVLETIIRQIKDSFVIPEIRNRESSVFENSSKDSGSSIKTFEDDVSLKQRVENAATSVTSAIIGGTLTTIVVFIPFFLLSKQLQILYSGVAITITTALLASLFIALTTVPYLAFRFCLGKKPSSPTTVSQVDRGSKSLVIKNAFMILWSWIPDRPAQRSSGMTKSLSQRLPDPDFLIERLKDEYSRLLPIMIQKRSKLLGVSLGLFLLAGYIFQFRLEKNLSKGEENNEFVVYVELPSGKRLDISDSIVKEVEQKIRAFEPTKTSIKSVTARVDGWSSKIYVGLIPPEKRKYSSQEVIERLRPLLKDVGKNEEAFVYFSAPQSGQELTINVYGEDEKTTADYAMQVAGFFEQNPGFTDTKIRYRPGRPEIKIMIDPERAALFGLNPTEIGNILHAQTRGLRATYFRQAGEEVETVVRLKVEQTNSLEAIKTLLIPTPHGGQVALEQMAKFDYSLAPSEIWRNNKQRMIQVSSNISKMSLEKAAEKAKEIIAQIPFTTDYSAEIGGDYADRVQAQRDFKNAMILTCLLIFAVLACLFESLIQPLLLFVSVPLAAIGIVLALLITKTPITMGVQIGVLMTGGIVVNNAILFIDHFNTHWDHQLSSLLDCLREAGRNRLRPILMTTLTTILGLLPMALDRSQGAELWRPMAITTIGGLMSSMILTLLVLPSLIYSIELMKQKKKTFGLPEFVIPAEAGIQVSTPSQSNVEELDPRFRGDDGPAYSNRGLLILFCVSSLLCVPVVQADTSLPLWVDRLVGRRVNDLMTEARRYEKKKDYSQAIQLNLEAVRLAPENQTARENLLRVNAKGLKEAEKILDKKRKKMVAEAWGKYRGEKALRDAMEGKLREAEREMNKGHLVMACDRYYQILDENPSYLPAMKGLDALQVNLNDRLEKGGAFESERGRQVAQGFSFFNQKKWAEATQAWSSLMADPDETKKWGTVRLGVYSARAVQNQALLERQTKIDAGLMKGLENFRKGNLKDAELSFKDVLALDPKNAQAKEYVRMIPGLKEKVRADVLTEVKDQEMAQTLSDAVEFYLKGFYDEAEAKVNLVLKEAPDHPQALGIADDIRKARGLPPVPTLEEKKTTEELKTEALYSDGIIAFAEGRLADAQTAWQEVLKRDPTNARAMQALKKITSEEKPNE